MKTLVQVYYVINLPTCKLRDKNISNLVKANSKCNFKPSPADVN